MKRHFRGIYPPKALSLIPAGFLAGAVNGILGCGGGIVTVLAMSSLIPEDGGDAEERTRRIFATTVLSVIPMSVASAIVYGGFGNIDFGKNLPGLLPAAIGGLAGGLLLDKINVNFLKKLFAVLIVYSGVKIMFGG